MMVDMFLYHTINLTGIKSELGAGSEWGQVLKYKFIEISGGFLRV
jgi:hypothetical protein